KTITTNFPDSIKIHLGSNIIENINTIENTTLIRFHEYLKRSPDIKFRGYNILDRLNEGRNKKGLLCFLEKYFIIEMPKDILEKNNQAKDDINSFITKKNISIIPDICSLIIMFKDYLKDFVLKFEIFFINRSRIYYINIF